MSTVVVATCPVCSLELTPIVCDPKEGARNGSVGGHIHMEVSGFTNCLNFHRWSASGQFMLTRES